MIERRELLAFAIGSLLLPRFSSAAQTQPPASARFNGLGMENGRLAALSGRWHVVESVWSNPGASPKVVSGLIADRRMIGSMLEEVLRRPPDPTPLRVDYLTFNRIEGQWQYVSMDFRAPVGIMPASSFDRCNCDKIELFFQPLAVPGDGARASGQMLRMKQLISSEGRNRQIKDQTFVMSDGSGVAWLAHRYTYVRQEPKGLT
jgi:hypothetical protein